MCPRFSATRTIAVGPFLVFLLAAPPLGRARAHAHAHAHTHAHTHAHACSHVCSLLLPCLASCPASPVLMLCFNTLSAPSVLIKMAF